MRAHLKGPGPFRFGRVAFSDGRWRAHPRAPPRPLTIRLVYGYRPATALHTDRSSAASTDCPAGVRRARPDRHRAAAAFMACRATSKLSGDGRRPRLGDLRGPRRDPPDSDGLYDAKLDHQPVVAIVGQQKSICARLELPAGGRPRRRCSRTSRASSCRSPSRPRRCTHLIDRAVQIARATRSVTCVIVPHDLAGGGLRSAAARARLRVTPAARCARPRGRAGRRLTCARAAEVLNAGEKSPSWSARAPATPATSSS